MLLGILPVSELLKVSGWIINGFVLRGNLPLACPRNTLSNTCNKSHLTDRITADIGLKRCYRFSDLSFKTDMLKDM